jgi:Tol biopolymer transport system component
LRGIYVYRLGSTGRQRLTTGCDDYPSWSHDSKRIVFARREATAKGTATRLYVAELESGQVKPLTEAGSTDDHPQWAPDDRSIAFSSNRTGNQKIWVLDLASRKVMILGRQPDGRCMYPQWSSDGKRLLVVSVASLGAKPIASIVHLTTSTLTPLKIPNLIDDRVVWSPDNRMVAFMRSELPRTWSICIARPDGTHAIRVLPKNGKGMKNGFGLAWQ